jgi:hypothetical protein
VETVPLVRRGEELAVTASNRRQYLGKWCRYRMVEQQGRQLDRLCAGFQAVLGPPELLAAYFGEAEHGLGRIVALHHRRSTLYNIR